MGVAAVRNCPLCRASLDMEDFVEIDCISRAGDELDGLDAQPLPRTRDDGTIHIYLDIYVYTSCAPPLGCSFSCWVVHCCVFE